METVYVITVCRNAASLIEETIQSVLGQTYQNLKYIIIDGASTDGTVDIIKRYENKLTLWISEPDKGIYDAMNKGLAKARELGADGWVNFMNAGDTFVSRETVAFIFSNESLEFDKIKMIGGGTYNVFEDSTKTFLDPAKSSEVIPREIPFSHQASFTKLGDWKYDTKYKIAADYKVMYNMFFTYGKDCIKTLDIPIANYRKDDSFSTINFKKAKGEYLAIQSKHRDLGWWKEYIKWRCF